MSVNTSTGIILSATITNAEWQILGAFIANVLQAGGVTRTLDTGQIDWSTAAFPGVNSTSGGYEIRQFTDALQATAPVFIKLDYRRGAGANKTEIVFTIGTGSNGLGTITGIKFTSNPCLITYINATWTSFISASSNRFAFMFQAASTSGCLMGIERTIDTSKVVTGAGVMILHTNPQATITGAIGQQYVPFSGTLPAAEVHASLRGGCFPPTNQTTGLHSDGNVAVYPVFFFGIGETMTPCTNFVGCFNNDFTNLTQYTVNVLGANQNMVKGSNGSIYYAIARGGSPDNNTICHMMRYD